MGRALRVVLLCVLSALSQWAHSASPEGTTPEPLDTITVIATRIEQRLSEVPATVSVITQRQLEDQLVTDIKDAVRFEPGVAVRNSPARFTAAGSATGRDGNSGFNIRGIEGNRVLMLVDGVRVPDGFSFGAQSNGRGDYVDLGLLRAIEIVRGPSSALYGSDGLAGAVSFVTAEPEDLLWPGEAFGLRARASYASADEGMSLGSALAGRYGAWRGMLAYTHRSAAEQATRGSNDAANSARTTAIPQDIGSEAVLGKLAWEISATQRLGLTLDYFERQVDSNVLSAIAIPPLSATSTLALQARDELRRDRISVDHSYEGSSWLSALRSSVYYQNSRTRELAREDRNVAADRLRDNTFDNRVVGGSVQFTSVIAAGTLEHTLTYGVDASRTRQVGVRDGTVPPIGEQFPTRAFPTTQYSLAGVYVQDALRLLDGKLTLYPAVRFDYYSIEPAADALFNAAVPQDQQDTRISPKLGTVLQLGAAVTLFASYGQGFKSPAPSQVNNGFTNVVANYRSIANPELRPETSATAEVGARWQRAARSVGISAFSGRYRDFIDQLQVGGSFTAADPALFQFINRGRVTISGVELKGETPLVQGFALEAAASYARGTSRQDGESAPLNSVEPLKVVAGLKWRNATRSWGGQLFVTHSAGKEAGRVDQSTCVANACFTPPSFTVLDATLWWNATPATTLRLGVFNIADDKYWWWSDVRGQSSMSRTLDAYTQPGRNVSASLVWQL